MRRAQIVIISAVAATLGWAAGHIGASSAVAQPVYDHLAIFAEVLGHVQNRYVDDTDERALIEAAIGGLLEELDPHSVYLDPEAYEAMRNDTRGEYVGVGIVIQQTDEGVSVQEVFDGGPASIAGMQVNDLLVAVGGESTELAETDEVVRLLRGRRGESVVVVVRRAVEDAISQDGGLEIELELVRDVIHLDAVVESQPMPGYGLVRLRQFQTNSSDDIRGAIDRLQADYGAELKGIVLDLRGNPGGLLNEAVAVSDVFLSSGEIVSTRGRAQPSNRWSAQRNTTRFAGPVVVLMNSGSASASEIVAGALQDNGRALVIGTQSYGKGSVQTIMDLSDGSGLKLTISRYYTPSGRSISGEGITPDRVVEAAEVDLSQNSSPSALDLAGVTDAQIRAALEYLSDEGDARAAE